MSAPKAAPQQPNQEGVAQLNRTFTVNTKLIISVSARPSSNGFIVYNNSFELLSLDFMHKPFALTSRQDLVNVLASVRILNLHGANVSMPFKEAAIPLLDEVDPQAKEIGAINTVLNTAGVLKGFNTDFEAARVLLQPYQGKQVLVLGTGGAAKAIIHAAIVCSLSVTVAGRNQQTLSELQARFKISTIPWEERDTFKAHVVVNCTPLGMTPQELEIPFSSDASIQNFDVVMDLVAKPNISLLISKAQSLGKKVITGKDFFWEQFKTQFRIYTGCSPPEKIKDLI